VQKYTLLVKQICSGISILSEEKRVAVEPSPACTKKLLSRLVILQGIIAEDTRKIR